MNLRSFDPHLAGMKVCSISSLILLGKKCLEEERGVGRGTGEKDQETKLQRKKKKETSKETAG